MPDPLYPTAALAHHWLVRMRGGERVLEQMLPLFGPGPILTLLARPHGLSATLRGRAFQTSPLSRLPAVERYYPALLPLLPWAARRLCIPESTRFVLSSDASVLKCLPVPAGIPHVCYCYSPPRYLWDLKEVYAEALPAFARGIFAAAVPKVREADRQAAQRVTRFVAISRFIRERIERCYGRDAVVLHPPVDAAAFRCREKSGDYYVAISELVPYKRLDLAVDCFNRLGAKLVVIGGGRQLEALRARARPNVRLLGPQPFAVLKETLENARALVFPGLEDFGIVMVESLACGKPVLAFGQGGALDIVEPGRTGLFFAEQSVEALAEVVERFERTRDEYDPHVCRRGAERFHPEEFRARLREIIDTTLAGGPGLQ